MDKYRVRDIASYMLRTEDLTDPVEILQICCYLAEEAARRSSHEVVNNALTALDETIKELQTCPRTVSLS